jgi:hypothetical protein
MTICIRLFKINMASVKTLSTDQELGREIIHNITENKEELDTNKRGEFMSGWRKLRKALL